MCGGKEPGLGIAHPKVGLHRRQEHGVTKPGQPQCAKSDQRRHHQNNPAIVKTVAQPAARVHIRLTGTGIRLGGTPRVTAPVSNRLP